MCHLPRAVYLLYKEKEGQVKRWLEQKYPSQFWELLLQLSDGNAFSLSVNFTSHRKNPFLPVSMVSGTAAVSMSPKSFPWGSVCIQRKEVLKMAYQNHGKEVRGI